MRTDYPQLRAEVLAAAKEGRATYVPAWSAKNPTALIKIDGRVVGQASSVGHFVCVAPDAPRFGESLLQPMPSRAADR